MSHRSYSTKKKLEVIPAFHEWTESRASFCRYWKINETTLIHWMDRYHYHGAEALTEFRQGKKYSPERKREAVKTSLTGKVSRRDILRIYGISSKSVFQRWIRQYHEGTLSKKRGGSLMTHARSTTWQE